MRGRQANTLLEARQRTCTQQHRWTAPASDGISTCVACGEERGELVAPSVDVIDQWSVEQPPSNCQHLWAAPDEEGISVCVLCLEERRGR